MLENILEEMRRIKDENRKENLYAKYPPKDEQGKILNAYSQGYEDGTDNFYNAMVDIIRKHMNGGWVPCEERMPKEDGFYLVTLNIDTDIDEMKVQRVWFSEKAKGFIGYRSTVIAWQPLPGPYTPKKETETDWSKVPVDTPIFVRNIEGTTWFCRHFAEYNGGKIWAYDKGKTSFTSGKGNVSAWIQAKLAQEGAK